jgi:hypothetical protein
MDFGEIFRVLRRWWPISVTVLLLAVVATVATYAKWPATYESDAEITLITPQAEAAQPGSVNNPFLGVDNLSPMAAILASSLSSSQSGQQLQALGVTDSFSAAVPAFAAGPFVALSLTGRNPQVIRKSMPIVISFAESSLKNLQETGLQSVSTDTLIRSVVIATPSAPTPNKKQKREVAAGVAIIGLLAVFLLSFGAEAIAQRRTGKPARKIDERAIAGNGAGQRDGSLNAPYRWAQRDGGLEVPYRWAKKDS